MTILNTRRLTMRRLAPEDIPAVMAMEADPEVMRYTTGLIEPTPRRRADLLAALATAQNADLGHWRVAQGADLIGWISLTPLEATGRIQLAYRFVRSVWGNGFATEAGEAILEIAQTVLKLPECVAIVRPGNHASSRVLSKLHFQREGIAMHYGHEVTVFFRPLRTTFP